MTIITNAEQVSAAWLTSVLHASGGLTAGHVTAVTIESGTSNWATNARLHLTYSADARGERPTTLFLKMSSTDAGDDGSFDDSEVRYYINDYIGVSDAPLIRCYGGGYSAALQRYHLLLADISATHIIACQKPPTLDYLLSLADGFAILHAAHWGSERQHDAAHFTRFATISEAGVEPILGAFATCPAAPHTADFVVDLEPTWPDLIRAIYKNHPQLLIDRNDDGRNLTLIHADPNCTNIMVPKEGDRPIYIIDRQPFDWSLRIWLGVYDLVYASLDWTIEQRRAWERPLLERYHQQLCGRGVTTYGMEQLWHDYRLCLPLGVYVATEYCRHGLNKPLYFRWYSALRRALTACEDHNITYLWA